MRINVAQQLKNPVGDRRHYTINETIEGNWPLQGEAKLVRIDRGILVTGHFSAVVKSTCSRCLEEFESVLTFSIEEEFYPVTSIVGEMFQPLSAPDEEEWFPIGEDNVLDLTEALRQNLLLSYPAKPVCRADCAGLCQKCGCNLNYEKCNCPIEQDDPRWAPLRQLLVD